jgi:glycerophosphoryl diester phosphodiesterase
MMILIKILIVCAVVLAGLYLLSTQGRTGHSGLADLKGWAYAHRGLHDENLPENSMAAFRAALENGYGIELDIHLMKDRKLAVIHDTSLLRTAGVDVKITDLTTEDLPNYPLANGELIPTFDQVLELFAGKAPLIIELKAENNAAALCEAACKAMEGYKGIWCMESFDPRCVIWLKKNRPDIIRGQLAENSFRNPKSKLPWFLKLVLSFHLENFLGQPDFIAYDWDTRHTLSNRLCRGLWKIQGVTWTLRSPEDHARALTEGWIPIFEHYEP